MRRIAVVTIVLCLMSCLIACQPAASVVGTWTQEDAGGYAFRLSADGRCVMLDSDGEWVSDGTYTVDDDRVYFETDTGSFVWIRTEEGMLFRANGHELLFHLQE